MQLSHFSTGGYVAHKVMLAGIKHSAWFDAEGKIIDAERIDVRGRCYTIKPGSFAWGELQRVAGGKQTITA